MRRFVLYYFIAPIVFYLISIVLLAIVTYDNQQMLEFAAVYIVAFPILTLVWWAITLARWMHNSYQWETVPYFIINLFLGIGIAGSALAISVGLTNWANAASGLVFLAGIVGSLFWIGRSLYYFAYKRESRYSTIHWAVLDAQRTSLIASKPSLLGKDRGSLAELSSKSSKSQRHEQKSRFSDSSVFRNVTVSTATEKHSDSGSIPIPTRETKKPVHTVTISKAESEEAYQPTISYRLSFPSSRSDFIGDAKKYVNRTENQANPVPFMQYWPTYSSMSLAQQKWYFYWRTQLRQGNRLPADTSYLFVYIYEVINLIGFNFPKDAATHLVKFWKYYRNLQPKLDNYLPDWIADFIVVHKLPLKPLEWYGNLAKLGSLGDEDLLIEAWLQSGGNFELLSNEIIYRLANYNPTKSKFYKQSKGDIDVEGAYKKGIESVDNFLRNNTGKSLFKSLQTSRSRVIKRIPFASALHSYPNSEIEIGTVHFWYSNEPLGKALRNILKYTENLLRDQNGYRYKLRDIDLDPSWERVIQIAFTIDAPKRNLEIDLSQVEQLKQESEAIRKRLNVDQETSTEQVVFPFDMKLTPKTIGEAAHIELVQEHNQNKQQTETIRDSLLVTEDEWMGSDEINIAEQMQEISPKLPGYLQRPEDVPDTLLTDLPEMAAVMGTKGSANSIVISTMMRNDWKCTIDTIQAALQGEFANVVIDRINEVAAEQISDALLFEENNRWIVLEEYRDEIQYILEHPEYQQLAPKRLTEIHEELDEEWGRLVDSLKPYHWDILAAVLSGDDVDNRIDVVAKQHHKTGNILIDEINDFAQENVGDLLIDTAKVPPQIIEDEIEHLTDLLSWAANHQLIEV